MSAGKNFNGNIQQKLQRKVDRKAISNICFSNQENQCKKIHWDNHKEQMSGRFTPSGHSPTQS